MNLKCRISGQFQQNILHLLEKEEEELLTYPNITLNIFFFIIGKVITQVNINRIMDIFLLFEIKLNELIEIKIHRPLLFPFGI